MTVRAISDAHERRSPELTARRFEKDENSFLQSKQGVETRWRSLFCRFLPVDVISEERVWARASLRRATTLALRDGPDVVVVATKRPISVAPIGREARFGSERSRPRVPRLESRRESFGKVCEATRVCCERHAFVVAFGTSRGALDRETGRSGRTRCPRSCDSACQRGWT